MSVQFGECNFDGKPVDPEDLEKVRPVLAPYGPDGEGLICRDNIEILYRAFHTTKESRREVQPHLCPSGSVITWDGRLDNRRELAGLLRCEISPGLSDAELVSAAYERWGTHSFSKLLGDWALSIWDPRDRCVILAKDFLGVRHLYYLAGKDHVAWSTLLDPLVLLAGQAFELEEEYIVGWFSHFPSPHLTPYCGILACPPACFVRLARNARQITKYWEFDHTKSVFYRTDAEYEEHFRTVLTDSVKRRLRSDSPVLAELSGGMDSSSIVCIADELLSRGLAEASRLDTVSYFDDSEPNWNERPYFSAVERKRGREGLHIDVSSQRYFQFATSGDAFLATPAHTHCPSVAEQSLKAAMQSAGNRTMLSGIGGDEFMGGVPSSLPELADYLVMGKLVTFFSRLRLWAFHQRTSYVHLLAEVIKSFFPIVSDSSRQFSTVPWLHPKLAEKCRNSLAASNSTFRILRGLPSFQENLSTIEHMREQIEIYPPAENPPYERSYPYLDRDLLEFTFALPPQHLIRPGQRRSLMRRALAGVVPESILLRKRKAYVARGPARALTSEEESIRTLTENMLASSMGIVDSTLLKAVFAKNRCAAEIPVMQLLRTLEVECWLRRSFPRFINSVQIGPYQRTPSLATQFSFTTTVVSDGRNRAINCMSSEKRVRLS